MDKPIPPAFRAVRLHGVDETHFIFYGIRAADEELIECFKLECDATTAGFTASIVARGMNLQLELSGAGQ